MKKDSPEQYLKYLAALSLTVAAPAVAAPAVTTESKQEDAQASTNLTTLASSVAEAEVGGCMGWPESTYVRRVIIIQPTSIERQAAPVASLSELMDEVLK